ncbi:MAG TPA: hypothetical protein P5069_10040, partial [Candidatus Hydrogenedentes bacterium]|nr:hypothetical protein [Candidatus Hydrogenedentota bacterium]
MMQGKFLMAILTVSVLSVLGCGVASAGYTITCTPYLGYNQENPSVGVVQFDPAPPEGGYETGTVVTLTAVPNLGFTFKEWKSGAVLGSDPVFSITIGVQDVNISAIFWVPNRYAANISVSPLESGTYSLDPPPGEDGKYDEGTLITVTAIPNSGYYYWHSNLDGSSSCGSDVFSISVSTNGRILYFSKNPTVRGSGSGEWGSLSILPASESGTYAPGTEITLNAAMNAGFSFEGFDIGTTIFPNNPCVFTVEKVCNYQDGNYYVNVRYEDVRPKLLSTTVSPVAAGTIQVSPPMPEGGYLDDPLVTLTAVANANYKFVHWDGDYAEKEATSSILEVRMDEERALVAVFEAVSCPECPGTGEGEPDDDEATGCACSKQAFTPEQIKKRLADFFLVGLMLGSLALARKRL